MAPPTNSKKRPAGGPSGAQNKNKKPRVAAAGSGAKPAYNGKPKDSSKPTRRGGQNVVREPKKPQEEVKRKAPITGRKYEEDLEEDEDVDMDDAEEDEFDEDVEMDGGEAVEGEATGIDGEQAKRLSKGKSSIPSHNLNLFYVRSKTNRTSRPTSQLKKQPSTHNNPTEQPSSPPTLFSKTPSFPFGKTPEEPI